MGDTETTSEGSRTTKSEWNVNVFCRLSACFSMAVLICFCYVAAANVWYVCFVDLMLTVMEASSFTPSVYSVHALTLLAEVKHSCL